MLDLDVDVGAYVDEAKRQALARWPLSTKAETYAYACGKLESLAIRLQTELKYARKHEGLSQGDFDAMIDDMAQAAEESTLVDQPQDFEITLRKVYGKEGNDKIMQAIFG